MAEEVRVDPAVLERVAVACRGLRDEARGAVAGRVEPETVDGARGMRGWYLAHALERVLEEWRTDLDTLGGHLERLGDAFDQCAREYRHADHAAASHFDIRGR